MPKMPNLRPRAPSARAEKLLRMREEDLAKPKFKGSMVRVRDLQLNDKFLVDSTELKVTSKTELEIEAVDKEGTTKVLTDGDMLVQKL